MQPPQLLHHQQLLQIHVWHLIAQEAGHANWILSTDHTAQIARVIWTDTLSVSKVSFFLKILEPSSSFFYSGFFQLPAQPLELTSLLAQIIQEFGTPLATTPTIQTPQLFQPTLTVSII